jgi:hypothetical protein
MSTATLNDSMIAEAAFRLWETEGRPEGRDQEHWFRARTALEALVATPDAIPAKPRTIRAKAAPKAETAAAPKAGKAKAKAL